MVDKNMNLRDELHDIIQTFPLGSDKHDVLMHVYAELGTLRMKNYMLRQKVSDLHKHISSFLEETI